MSDLKDLLELNKIIFDDRVDATRLVNEGLTITNNNEIYVNYKSLIPIMFPHLGYMEKDIYYYFANVLIGFFRRIIRNKLEK